MTKDKMFSMKKYRYTEHGLGHITVGGNEYMLEHGDEIELPEDDAKVKELVELGYLVECVVRQAHHDNVQAAAGVEEEVAEVGATGKRKARTKPDSSTEVNGANATEGEGGVDAGKQ